MSKAANSPFWGVHPSNTSLFRGFRTADTPCCDIMEDGEPTESPVSLSHKQPVLGQEHQVEAP